MAVRECVGFVSAWVPAHKITHGARKGTGAAATRGSSRRAPPQVHCTRPGQQKKLPRSVRAVYYAIWESREA